MTTLATGVMWLFAIAATIAPTVTMAQNNAKPVKAVLAPVTLTQADRIFEAVGKSEAAKSAFLYPEVQERVVKVYFKAQDKVKDDQLLVQLDDKDQQLALKLANVRLANAKRLLERYQSAVAQGAVPQTQVDEAQAEVDAAEVAVEQAKLAVADRQVRAPFDGIVGIPRVDKGQRVYPDTLISGIDFRAKLEVEFEIPEALTSHALSQPASSLQVQATTPSLAGVTFPAKVIATDNRLDPIRKTLMLKAVIDNPEDQLRPGMTFQMRWTIPGTPLPTVPEMALQWTRDGSFVWVSRDGKAAKTMAKVVDRRDGNVLLEGALNRGDLVVVEGVQRMREGIAIENLNAPNKQPSQAKAAQ